MIPVIFRNKLAENFQQSIVIHSVELFENFKFTNQFLQNPFQTKNFKSSAVSKKNNKLV